MENWLFCRFNIFVQLLSCTNCKRCVRIICNENCVIDTEEILWIQCEDCHRWFHQLCVGISEKKCKKLYKKNGIVLVVPMKDWSNEVIFGSGIIIFFVFRICGKLDPL